MDHFLICENPACRFVVDSNIPGETPKRHAFVLSQCPECGSEWSSTCPFFRPHADRALDGRRPALPLLQPQAARH